MFLLVVMPTILAAAPEELSYQGMLTDSLGMPAADSDYEVTFGLYTDSIAGSSVWGETAMVQTTDGLFAHSLGSISALPTDIFSDYGNLYLAIRVGAEILEPRTQLLSVPYSRTAAGLVATGSSGELSVKLFPESHGITLYDTSGANPVIELTGSFSGDSAVMLPDSAINSEEIVDEPGLAFNYNVSSQTLTTGEMIDLLTVTIAIPADGYVVLHGKCYAMFSGTTGSNIATIQIDETEGGSTQFPYFSRVGLGGYANTAISYFPVYVTRTYYRAAGQYTFRMEGMASDETPALAKTWDHILTAIYYPTSYYGTKALVTDPDGFPGAVQIQVDGRLDESTNGVYYDVDLRLLESKSKTVRKTE